ncbi:hypothetical protein L596_015544 [Steinernema carpocapsae]|uniref:RRM domain-containing protein n=1 Tax=Steinernema carpocapsae TaxID=34508 RepID=A0A4V6A354_STECR|nr:hypothetical protein L596_015544 [Steinernema carpocapsae]
MNPITNIKNLNKMNERELALGINNKNSWHQKYIDSAWIFVGGLPYALNEGDVISVFSQYGEIVNINLVRDSKTGKSKGFAFLCYDDQRSTVLAVDNLNGISLVGRMIKVDHVEEYKVPKFRENVNEETLKLWSEGCAPKPIEIAHEGSRRSEDREESKARKEKSAKKARKEEKKLAKQMKKEKKRRVWEEIVNLDQGLEAIGVIDDELKEILKQRKEEKKRKKEDKKRMIRGEEMEDRSGMNKDDWKSDKGVFMDRGYAARRRVRLHRKIRKAEDTGAGRTEVQRAAGLRQGQLARYRAVQAYARKGTRRKGRESRRLERRGALCAEAFRLISLVLRMLYIKYLSLTELLQLDQPFRDPHSLRVISERVPR